MHELKTLNEAIQTLERTKTAFESMSQFAQNLQQLQDIDPTETRFRLRKESGKIIKKQLTKINKTRENKVLMQDIASKMGITNKTLSLNVNGVNTMDGKYIGILLAETGLKMEDIVKNIIVEMPFNLVATQIKQEVGEMPSDENVLKVLDERGKPTNK